MRINGSPSTKALFGCDSQDDDLFEDIDLDIPEPSGSSSCFTTPVGKRPRVTPPSSVVSKAPSISPLSAAVSRSVKGLYGSQEATTPVLLSDVWDSVQGIGDKNPVLEQFSIRNVIQGTCLYRGKSAHMSVMIKSVECVSNQDTSLIVCDETGEMRAAVHHKVKEKYGGLLVEGAGLLLRQCTIFSFISVQKYINITLPNVLYIFNSSSTAPSPSTLEGHLKEVREVLERKEAAPEESGGPPMINTPNRPPPPRTRSSLPFGLTTPGRPSLPSGLTTPNRSSGSGLTTPGRPSGSGLTTPSRPNGSGITTPNRPSGSGLTTPGRPSGSGITTPGRPTPNLFGTTTPARNPTTSSSVVLTTPVRRPVKRTSGGEPKLSITTQPTNEVKQYVMSEKEKDEISKLLDEVDDDFFD